MNDSITVKNSVIISATPQRVWHTLTDPKLNKRYMFDCEGISSWEKGSSVEWKGTKEGKEIVFVKGRVISAHRPHYLEFTVFDPNSKYKDIAQNYLKVKVRITPKWGKTKLTISQGNFASVEDGQKRYEDTVKGWDSVMDNIKAVAQSDKAE
jgi:uncharacterized protein YndB with AHSA1/START domain